MLNNIIVFGDSTYRYINFATYESGDMVVETTCFPISKKRMFFGLKQNGRPFFTKNGENIFFSTDIINNSGKVEAEGAIIKLSTAESNEYFMSISKLEMNAEIIDFNTGTIYFKSTAAFTYMYEVKTLRHAFIPLESIRPNYYYLFGFIGTASNVAENKIYFQKHKFSSLTNFGLINQQDATKNQKINAYGREVSCFQTTANKLIICFYLTKVTTYSGYGYYQANTKYYFNLLKYKSDLTDDKTLTIESSINNEKLFLKCIHLKDDAGVFVSYETKTNKIYPFILFKDYDINANYFTNYLPTSMSKIIIEKEGFNYNVLLNDIVKLNNNKIAFSAPLQERRIVYIIILNIFTISQVKKVKIRYYLIQLYDLYHLRILSDLRIHKYNNYLAFAISYCPQELCENDDNEHYPGLMIFSYPNSTDITINFDTYLFENNIDPRNFNLDLTNALTLENNIFGYILSNIYIIKIDGPHSKYFAYSSKDESIKIEQNYKMEKDEKLIFKFTGDEQFLPKMNKKIEYYFIATEPEYNIYDTYPDEIEGESDEYNFSKEEYIGRLSYLYIKSELEFLFSCPGENCNFNQKR